MDVAVNTSILTLAGYQMAMARRALAAPLDILVSDLIGVLTGALTAELRESPSSVAQGTPGKARPARSG